MVKTLFSTRFFQMFRPVTVSIMLSASLAAYTVRRTIHSLPIGGRWKREWVCFGAFEPELA